MKPCPSSVRRRPIYDGSNSRPEFRNDFRLEPRVPLEPRAVSWARVREREPIGPPVPPGSHCIGDALPADQVIILCVSPEDQREADVRQSRQNLRAPRRSALPARWSVPRGTRARETEAHGDDRHDVRIVEFLFCHPHPVSKPHTTGVGERHPRFVYAAPRRLPCDEDSCGRMDLKDRPWAFGKLALAYPARSHTSQEIGEHHLGGRVRPPGKSDALRLVVTRQDAFLACRYFVVRPPRKSRTLANLTAITIPWTGPSNSMPKHVAYASPRMGSSTRLALRA